MSSKVLRGQAIQKYRSTHDDAELSLLSEEKKKFNPNVSTADLIEDLRRVQLDNPDTYITRKVYRKLGKYSDSTWDTRMGTFSEFRKQARLELSRGQGALEKHIAKHASLDVVRGFAEVEVLPWCGKYEKDHTGRWQTMVVASDFHDKDTDLFALEVFLDTCKRVQPSIICLAGDIYEAYEFSRFDKDPRQWDAAGRLAWVRDNIYRPLRKSCPKAQIDLIAGNHENFLIRHMADRTPELRAILSDFMGLTLADMLGLREFEINLVCQNDLSAFRAADIRKEMTKNRRTYFGCVTVNHYPIKSFSSGTNWVAGHTHKFAMETGCNEILGSLWGVTNGCMCKIDNVYTENNRNQNGFTVIHIDTHCKKAIAEPILFSDNSCMVGGTKYERKNAKNNG